MDQKVTRIATPERQTDAERSTQLYRHFDKSGALLYVGVSLSSVARLSQHRDGSAWFSEIARVEVSSFQSREAALIAERKAIEDERPKHNIAHNRAPKITPIRQASTHDLFRKVVFKPVYKISEAGELLGVPVSRLKRWIEEGKIGCMEVPSSTGNKVHTFVSGWQVIEFIEAHEKHKGDVRWSPPAYLRPASNTID